MFAWLCSSAYYRATLNVFLFYFTGMLLSPSKWHHMHWSGDRATLTLTHLNKEDEGLYTLRVTTKSGYETYSSYVFVRGGYTFSKSYLDRYISHPETSDHKFSSMFPKWSAAWLNNISRCYTNVASKPHTLSSDCDSFVAMLTIVSLACIFRKRPQAFNSL